MKVQLLGLADHVTVGGLSGPQTYKADQESQLVAFQFSGAWDEAKGHAAARAMEAAGNVVASGGAVRPCDVGILETTTARDFETGTITAIHLAQNEGLLQGTSGQVAAAVGLCENSSTPHTVAKAPRV